MPPKAQGTLANAMIVLSVVISLLLLGSTIMGSTARSPQLLLLPATGETVPVDLPPVLVDPSERAQLISRMKAVQNTLKTGDILPPTGKEPVPGMDWRLMPGG